MVDCTFDDDTTAIKLWKNNYSGRTTVPWSQFNIAFYGCLNEPIPRNRDTSINYKCLRKLIAEGDNPEALTVSLERFGLFSKWFGPIKGNEKNLLDNVGTILGFAWFHGDVTKQHCESLLGNFKKGYWLIRASHTEPEKTPFTLSKVNKKGQVDHQRIYVSPGNKGYYSNIKHKNGTKKVEAQSLVSLVKKLKEELKLSHACPGSQYRDVFLSSEGVGTYLEDDDS